tara:strand:+ start:62 stop:721 length:660 start_codon:yes stop_codon:yes gene_type:complete
MKNINLVKDKEADNYFLRNINYYSGNSYDKKIIDLIKINNLKAEKILEIGCANGKYLNQFSKLLKSKKSYGVDLSKKAIQDGKKKFKNLNLLKISSLEIDKIKSNFDFIICGFFLYLLDRELIFNQFDLIYKKLNKNGLLLIVDYDPLFKHTNNNVNKKNLMSYKMNYDNFLIESGLFEMLYKFKFKGNTRDKSKFKSEKSSITLFKKIDFQKSYPENI